MRDQKMKKQQGSVLIITVVVLFAATMISLYAMRGTIIQDKMTANINNKVTTSNVAEDGATQFLNWFNDRFKTGGAGWPSPTEQATVWQGNIADGLIPYTNPVDGLSAGNVQNGRYYWIDKHANIEGCPDRNTNPCWMVDSLGSRQVTVQVTGNIVKGTGNSSKVIGTSVYQVKFAAPKQVRLPDLPAALTLAGDVGGFDAANSRPFNINGRDKLAVATMNATSNNKVTSDIARNNRENNYYGDSGGECPTTGACVKNTDLGMWGDANQVMQYVEAIRGQPNVRIIDSNETSLPVCSDHIVVVLGSLSLNRGHSGCGGTFKGILLVLGGELELTGNVFDLTGAVYVANIQPNGAGGYQFASNPTGIKGGGNMTFTYSSENLMGGDGTGGFTSRTSILSWNDIL